MVAPMIDPRGPIARDYRQARRADRWLGAREALRRARATDSARSFWNADEESNEWAAAEWSDPETGYAYRAVVVSCDDNDLSWLGEWTDNPDGAIPNDERERGSYAYFRPENPGIENYPYFRRAGMGRTEARERCADLDREAMRQARSSEDWFGVEVTASLGGRVFGTASLWECYDSDRHYPYLAEVAAELAPEAAHEADRTIARKLGTVAEVIA